jgi:hypothetical protein
MLIERNGNAPTQLNNVTIVNNRANITDGAYLGGGIYLLDAGDFSPFEEVRIANSIIASTSRTARG